MRSNSIQGRMILVFVAVNPVLLGNYRVFGRSVTMQLIRRKVRVPCAPCVSCTRHALPCAPMRRHYPQKTILFMRLAPQQRIHIRDREAPWFFLAAALLAALVAAGCGSSAPLVLPEESGAATATEERIRDAVSNWRGTPYEWGGTSRSGLDCSAFTQIIYRDVFGVDIPRTTTLQAREGAPVDPPQLKTGDLVFFHPREDLRHVGVYLGGRDFAHVSSNRGVTISRLDKRYWRKRYWTARRILPSGKTDGAAAVMATEEPSDPADTSSIPDAHPRKGW